MIYRMCYFLQEIERRRRIEAKYEGDVIEIQNLLNEEKEQRNRMQVVS